MKKRYLPDKKKLLKKTIVYKRPKNNMRTGHQNNRGIKNMQM